MAIVVITWLYLGIVADGAAAYVSYYFNFDIISKNQTGSAIFTGSFINSAQSSSNNHTDNINCRSRGVSGWVDKDELRLFPG